MSSMKQLFKENVLKKADLPRIRYRDLIIVPGFNGREEGERLEKSNQELFEYIMAGGQVPPLEVHFNDQGGVEVVDGHRRHWAYGKAIAAGAPIEWIDVLPFRGNDVDRVARIVTSDRKLSLTPLEVARIYKRMAGFRLSTEEIAQRVCKTRQHVEQMLVLANANNDVHMLVADGMVPAHIAVDAVREHGESAGEFLASQVKSAKSQGKSSVTKQVITGRAIPKKIVSGLMSKVESFAGSLGNDVRVKLAELENLPKEALGEKVIEIRASVILELLQAHNEVEVARKKELERVARKQAQASQGDLTDEQEKATVVEGS